MTKTKQKNLVPVVALAIACLGLAVGLTISLISNIQLREKNDKMNTILEIACYYSGDSVNCDRGVKMLMGMDLNDLKDYRFGNFKDYMGR